MTFSELPPSNHWAALTFRGEKFAEVWFKPDGDPQALTFRIPRDSFLMSEISERLTIEKLLKAVALAGDEVESCRLGDSIDGATDDDSIDLASPLPMPPEAVDCLEILVRLKPAMQAAAGESRVVSAEWHDLEARWKDVLGHEAAVDTLRKNVESLRAELEASMRRALTADEKVHALAADVAQWTKAKSRAHFALPKASEFIHRATWALGAPERKRLGELFKNPLEAQDSLPRAEDLVPELEMLRKDRQVLTAKGTAVYQECKAIIADVQSALRRLQSNAATRASQKKGAFRAKGKLT